MRWEFFCSTLAIDVSGVIVWGKLVNMSHIFGAKSESTVIIFSLKLPELTSNIIYE